eukprot:7006011-Ditylum_brightwellii.AAC.1
MRLDWVLWTTLSATVAVKKDTRQTDAQIPGMSELVKARINQSVLSVEKRVMLPGCDGKIQGMHIWCQNGTKRSQAWAADHMEMKIAKKLICYVLNYC